MKNWIIILLIVVTFCMAIALVFSVLSLNGSVIKDANGVQGSSGDTNSPITGSVVAGEASRWLEMPLTYNVDAQCGDYESNRVDRAFSEIMNATGGVVRFKKVASSGNISVHCQFLTDCYHLDIKRVGNYRIINESICEHEKGIAQINDFNGPIINKADITLYGLAGFAESGKLNEMSGFAVGSCGYPNTEIHEILHTFGIGHSSDPKSIMYPVSDEFTGYRAADPLADSCSNVVQKIDDSIINQLINTYK